MAILLDTFFEATAQGHGGNRRSAQILELLQNADIQVDRLERPLLTSAKSRYLAAIAALCRPQTWAFVWKHQLKVGHSPFDVAFCGFQRQLYHQALTHHLDQPDAQKLMLWEATKNYVAPYVAKDAGFRVVALPHNLESFVPDDIAFHGSLTTEIESLAKADIVFCIAREEEWLLRLHGVNAHYLPYYPPQAVLDQLLEIRRSRQNNIPERFLIVGSADNPPTRQGMVEQLTWLKQLRQPGEFQVDVVGYGTESLRQYADANVTVLGAVSTDRLNQLLIQAKAALVHQTPSSGALTRIPELLIAGIPVIANVNACRSAYEYEDLYSYDSPEELKASLDQLLVMPLMPAPPTDAEQRFLAYIQTISSQVQSCNSHVFKSVPQLV